MSLRPRPLVQEILDLIGRARPLVTDERKNMQWECEANSWKLVWVRHVQEGDRLIGLILGLEAASMPTELRAVWRELTVVIRQCNPALRRLVARIPATYQQGNRAKGHSLLRVGCGNPHALGCSDARGQTVRLDPLLNQATGVMAAFRELSLDVIGLPAARMSSKAANVVGRGYRMYSRGEASYASTAIIWREGVDLQVLERPGSDRRLWSRVPRTARPLLLVVLQFPPSGGTAKNEEWVNELSHLEADLAWFGNQGMDMDSADFLFMGDMNMQPEELGGGPETHLIRQRCWDKFKSKWGFVLHSPTLHGQSPQELFLPLRQRSVTIKPSSSHHGRGCGRLIDLVWSTPRLQVAVTIHNGIHCGGEPTCSWKHCVEYAGGDHFFQGLQVNTEWHEGCEPATPRFPATWRCEERWRAALPHADAALAALELMLSPVSPGMRVAGGTAQAAEQWLVDAAAWTFSTIAHLVRDAWVHVPHGKGTTNCVPQLPPACPLVANEIAFAKQLRDMLQQRGICLPLVHKCYQWLRDKKPEARRQMAATDGSMMSPQETHAAWTQQLLSQCTWAGGYDTSGVGLDVVMGMERVARSFRGSGVHDQDVQQLEALTIMANWDASDALPPDLIPRAPFKCGSRRWQVVVWLLLRFTGPACLALRPRLWRLAAMVALYKRGEAVKVPSFRQIMVKSQLGLLQEGLLSTRLAPTVRAYLSDYQGGYVRGVEDAHLLFHDLCAWVHSVGLVIWALLGDFKGAFPHVWRADLLALLASGPKLHGGAMALLVSIFQQDLVVVRQSGDTEVVVHNGIPEGGTMGTLTYTVLPDSLIKELQQGQHGVGWGYALPESWVGRQWVGSGVPQQALVQKLVADLRHGGPLPGAVLLDNFPDLEASALRALDLAAPVRVVAILQADDPVLLGSSRGALQAVVDKLGSWAVRHRAIFHTGANKSVVMVVGNEKARVQARNAEPILLTPGGGQANVSLQHADYKQWLGLPWPHDLDFSRALEERLRLSGASFSVLAGLVQDDVIPLPLAVVLFEAKVDGVAQFGRWLIALAPNAESRLDQQYEAWAKALIGSPPWRNGVVAQYELGWCLSGYARAVKSMATRAAALSQFPSSDLVRTISSQSQAEGSWWTRAHATFKEWGLPTWHQWSQNGADIAVYKCRVEAILADRCKRQVEARLQAHQGEIPYGNFQASPSNALSMALRAGLPWEVLLGTRSWSKLRLGLLELSHRNGHRSRAKEQSCLFCGRFTKRALWHCLGQCEHWQGRRRALLVVAGHNDLPVEQQPRCSVWTILKAHPSSPAVFVEAVMWSRAVDRDAAEWWKTREG